jgi:hypothetical protein
MMRKAKKPKMWANRMIPSANGRWWAPQMLKATIRKVNANMSSVTCHWVEKVVSGLAVAISCWMMPANCVAHDGTPAIQPIVEAQPAAYESGFCKEAGANSETQSALTLLVAAHVIVLTRRASSYGIVRH